MALSLRFILHKRRRLPVMVDRQEAIRAIRKLYTLSPAVQHQENSPTVPTLQLMFNLNSDGLYFCPINNQDRKLANLQSAKCYASFFSYYSCHMNN